jgi:formiminoglutamase
MARVRDLHGFAILYDCHSIRSRIPFLFEGVLPDFNIGSNNGETCAAGIETSVHRIARASGRSCVLNGRFKGGWTTRHYGRPDQGWHAIQMELAQSSHLATEAALYALDPGKAAALRPVLSDILHALKGFRP